MNLLPTETILRESSSKALVVTTHRIRYESQSVGTTTIQSIMLEEVASCAIAKTSQPIWWILAIVCVVLGMLLTGTQRSTEPLIGCVVLGVIFAVVYFTTQQQVLAFASAGTTIRVNTGGMKLETAKEYIHIVEMAKNARYFLLT